MTNFMKHNVKFRSIEKCREYRIDDSTGGGTGC
jgi:hypothetical protein